jgi:hypothetical protein
MINKAKIMQGLECCSKRKDGDDCDNCPYFSGCATEYGSFTELASQALMLIEEQTRILKLYSKTDGYLYAHGWDWTTFPEWKEQSVIEDIDWME